MLFYLFKEQDDFPIGLRLLDGIAALFRNCQGKSRLRRGKEMRFCGKQSQYADNLVVILDRDSKNAFNTLTSDSLVKINPRISLSVIDRDRFSFQDLKNRVLPADTATTEILLGTDPKRP